MDWQSYEEVVKDIFECIGASHGVSIVCWGPSCLIQGRSGVSHQIDVLTTHSDGVASYKTAIQCKHWNTKVSLNIVRDMIGVLADTDIDKGIIVSKSGFTVPAKALTLNSAVGLLELREPLDMDWEGYIREVAIHIYLQTDTPYDLRFVCKGTGPPRHTGVVDTHTVSVRYPDGSSTNL